MKKTVLISLAVIAALFLAFVDWGKDPREWVVGKWYEPNHRVTAIVDRDTVTVQMEGKREMQVYYELDVETSGFKVWQHQKRYGTYEGTYEFKGKNKVIVKARIRKGASDLEKMMEGLSSTWQRVKE